MSIDAARNAKIVLNKPAEAKNDDCVRVKLPKLTCDQCPAVCSGASNLKRHIKNFHSTVKEAQQSRCKRMLSNQSQNDAPSKRPQYVIAKKKKRNTINSTVLRIQDQDKIKVKLSEIKSEPIATRSKSSRLISLDSLIQCEENNCRANESISSENPGNVFVNLNDVDDIGKAATPQTQGKQSNRSDYNIAHEWEGETVHIDVPSQQMKDDMDIRFVIAKKRKHSVDPGSVSISSTVLRIQDQDKSKSSETISKPMVTCPKSSILISQYSLIQNDRYNASTLKEEPMHIDTLAQMM